MNKQVYIILNNKKYYCDIEVLNLINRLCDKVELLEYNRDKALEYNDYLIRDAKYHLYLVHLKKMKKKIKGDV